MIKPNKMDTIVSEYLSRLKVQGIKKIIGFSIGPGFEKRKREVLEESLDQLKGLPIAILLDRTSGDITRQLIDLARENSIPIIGVYSQADVKQSKRMDFAIEVPAKYGPAESPDSVEVFAKIPQGLEIIGGDMKTATEFAYIMGINETRLPLRKRPIYVAPVNGVGGEFATFADMLYTFSMPRNLQICLPDKRFYNGKLAANFLIQKLRLHKLSI